MPPAMSASSQTTLFAHASYWRALGYLEASTSDDLSAKSDHRSSRGPLSPGTATQAAANQTAGPTAPQGRCSAPHSGYGRTTAATAAARQQQWRRPCLALPSFQRKINKGQRLSFDGQWRCTVCPCPSGRLATKRCRGPSSPEAVPCTVPSPPRPRWEPRRPEGTLECGAKAGSYLAGLLLPGTAGPQGSTRLSEPPGGRLKASLALCCEAT